MEHTDPFISKSKYLSGLQCPKLLWYHTNSRDDIPEPDDATQAVFDTGHVVGNLAKQLYPDGIEVPRGDSSESRVAATTELLSRRKPIFEATFLEDRAYCQVDILVPVENEAWDLIEVKSGTSVKPVNLEDVTFQANCLERAGVAVKRVCVMHIDNTYVRRGDIDPSGLFHVEDVTAKIHGKTDAVPGTVERLLRVAAGPNPDVPIGPHCTNPYDCGLRYLCWDFLPEHPVTELTRGKRKAFEFISQGICRLTEAPENRLTERQLLQQKAVASGQPHIDPDEIRGWLTEFEFPIYCLDFETMNPAIPLFDGTRPYQQVPFQFSLHVLQDWNATPEHHEFLAADAADPRPALIDHLRALGPTGTLLAYNMKFERRVIRRLASNFPQHREFLEGLLDRFRDLATPFRRFWYHHPDQKGRYSLKAVLPVLTGTTYDDLAIGAGDEAAREFLRVIHGDAPAPEKADVLAGLREYCKQDTMAMVHLLHSLRGMV